MGELITLSLIKEPQHDRRVPTRDACAHRMLILTNARAKQVFSLYSARAKPEGGKHERPAISNNFFSSVVVVILHSFLKSNNSGTSQIPKKRAETRILVKAESFWNRLVISRG